MGLSNHRRGPRQRRANTGAIGRRLFGAALALALALSCSQSSAHPGHGEGIYAALVGVEEAPPGAVGLRVLLVNNTPGAAMLRGLSAPGGPVELNRRRSLLGLELLQPVQFLRLESGHRVLLAAPEYVVSAHGLDIDTVIRGEVVIQADFGPLGKLPLEVVGAPQTTE